MLFLHICILGPENIFKLFVIRSKKFLAGQLNGYNDFTLIEWIKQKDDKWEVYDQSDIELL